MKPARNAIDGFSIENILQISSMERRSHTMIARSLDNVGYIYTENGILIDAITGELKGESALTEILCWEDVNIELTDYHKRERTIQTPLMKILLNASKCKDERLVKRKEAGIDLLENAIELAEAHQYKAAYKEILAYLKKNKKNAGGLIWYSRIHGNIEVMEKALQAACRLSPNDSFVVEEQKKFNLAKKKLNGDAIRKCCFCWTPLSKSVVRCHHCSGYLTISKEALSVSDRPNPSPFINAIKRYSRIKLKFPQSQATHYYLSLAHLNMGNLKEALHALDTLTKQVPEKELFAHQLTLLIDYLAATAREKGVGDKPTNTKPEKNTENNYHVKELARAEVNRKKILVVEDSPTIRKVITISLKRSGYDIVEAEDGLEALSRVSESPPDLILLDVVLPKMDGFKILSLIKRNKELKAIPVIMLTSKDGIINKVKGKVAGAAAYLTKPFDPKKMIEEIEKHIQ